MARPWYARYPADYARKTRALSLVQHGAYTLLLDDYYSNGPLPNDEAQLRRLCGVVCDSEYAAVCEVLGKFFVNTDAGWVNKRADKELVKAAEISEARSVAGAKGNAKLAQLRSQTAAQIEPLPQSQPQAKRAVASRWKSDQAVSDQWKQDGQEARGRNKLPPIDLNLAAELFENYWSTKSGQDATKLDWHKTWLTWVLRTKAEQKINGGRNDNGSGKAQTQFERLQAKIAAGRAGEGQIPKA